MLKQLVQGLLRGYATEQIPSDCCEPESVLREEGWELRVLVGLLFKHVSLSLYLIVCRCIGTFKNVRYYHSSSSVPKKNG